MASDGQVIRRALQVGRWASFLAPVVGLLVFWLVPFKPAVTLYAGIVGLGIVLLKAVESAWLSLEMKEIARRQVHESYAR